MPIFSLLIAIVVISSALILGEDKASFDWFSQRNFPCAEDEVLTYIIAPTNDRTGCINREEIFTDDTSFNPNWEQHIPNRINREGAY